MTFVFDGSVALDAETAAHQAWLTTNRLFEGYGLTSQVQGSALHLVLERRCERIQFTH